MPCFIYFLSFEGRYGLNMAEPVSGTASGRDGGWSTAQRSHRSADGLETVGVGSPSDQAGPTGEDAANMAELVFGTDGGCGGGEAPLATHSTALQSGQARRTCTHRTWQHLCSGLMVAAVAEEAPLEDAATLQTGEAPRA